MHTLVRIPAGAALAASVFGDSPPAWTLAAGILGGTLAAGSHFTKAGARMAINTSPEPFSNWAASFGEDLLVGVLLYLALAHPLALLLVLAALLALSDLAAAEAVAVRARFWRADRALARWRDGARHAGPPDSRQARDV